MATKTAPPSTVKASESQRPAAPGKSQRRQARAGAPASTKTVAFERPSKPQARAPVATEVEPGRPVLHAVQAAQRAVASNTLHVQLPVVGDVKLPDVDQIAFIGGVTVLAFAGLIEWPVAVVLGIGHGMATLRHNKLLKSFGEALEEA